MKRSLRTRVKFLILMPLLFMGVIAALASLLLGNAQIHRQTGQDIRTTTSALSSYIREQRAHLEMQTKLLAEVPYLKQAALTRNLATAQDRVDAYTRSLDCDGLILTDPEGKPWARGGTFVEGVAANLKSAGVEPALDGKYWSGTITVDGRLTLIATAPLMVGEYAKGTISCYRFVDSKTAGSLARSLSTEVVFVADGKVLASSLPISAVPNHAGPVQISVQDASYVGEYAHLPSAAPQAKVGFYALRNVDEIVGPSRRLMMFLLIILGCAIIGSAILANRSALQIVRPLDGLVAAAATLQQGNWPSPFEDLCNDELGVLQSSFNQMTEALREHERKLLGMINTDALTGLPNHRGFKELAAPAIDQSFEDGECASLLLIDVDDFSQFSRNNGLLASDAALVLLADTLKSIVPERAVVCRYGGDEFGVLLLGHSVQEALPLAERIRSCKPQHLPPLSCGCSEIGHGTTDVESLTLAAELALAKAKQLGGNRVCDFSSVAGEGSDPFQLNRLLQDGTLATIQALAAAVDAKDAYTKGHSQRVAQYAADLCAYLGGSEDEVELVFRTGTLHDVGKIGVADSVLKKEGPLDAEERATMETHPVLGEVIVKKVPQLSDTLPGVRHHHERWDGKGYPDGLSGENIPRLARLLAVADTFDAMTSDRPYRRGLSIDVALGEISKNAGVQFDPSFAEAFVAMVREHQPAAEAA
jgi:diguanylate cyclase (GGDEF)-like protein